MLSIILVVYKTEPEKLKYILGRIDKKYSIIIIDNSTNYNFSNLKISKKTKIIRSKNIGNGAGINLGLKHCKTNYALYADLDVTLKIDFIDKFQKFSVKNKDFAIMMPNHGNINSKKNLVERYDDEGPVMLFNKKILRKIGFFDEKFFLYFEEMDLFFRCKKNKLKVFYASKFRIKHNRASSISSNKEKIKNLRAWHYMWSMFYFYKKNYSFVYAIKKIYILLIKDIFMMLVFLFLINKIEFNLRFNRVYGVISAILGLKSFKRP